MAENSIRDLTKEQDLAVSINNPNNGDSSRPSSVNKVETLHWFALLGSKSNDPFICEDTAYEDRARIVRDRQNEERIRKLNEIKQQALLAQKLREQKEEERRKRMEEMRVRDMDRRHQVEERKRQIEDAERDRRESILRKNQERDARLETKRRNDRSSSVFAFGSSTPRMLEPVDSGGSFWMQRRATSITNMFTGIPPSRRSSEREVDGSKKRATSAGGLNRELNEDLRMSSSMYEVFHWFSPSPPLDTKSDENTNGTSMPAPVTNRVARRRTDLMPTIPSPRDSGFPLKIRSPGIRSGEVTPSRPGSALSGASSVMSNVVVRRPASAAMPRKPRPASIAGTGINYDYIKKNTLNSDVSLEHSKPPLPHPRTKSQSKVERIRSSTGTKSTSSVHGSAMSTPLNSPKTENKPIVESETTTSNNKPVPVPPKRKSLKTASSVPADTKGTQQSKKLITNNVSTNVETEKKTIEMQNSINSLEKQNGEKLIDLKENVSEIVDIISETNVKVEENLVNLEEKLNNENKVEKEVIEITKSLEKIEINVDDNEKNIKENDENIICNNNNTKEKTNETNINENKENVLSASITTELSDVVDMTASMMAKTRITTEEEAKAALAEKRRLAREEAERKAELERKRLEAEAQAEEERLRAEEEEQHRLEEETLRLAEAQREAEERRLRDAIEEAKKREEEEQQRREEEIRQRIEKEEAERKAREEAERQRIELAEKLQKEEKEREARRKRVEAIMSRTRGKGGSAANSPMQNNDNGDRSSSVVSQTQGDVGEIINGSSNTDTTNIDSSQIKVDNEFISIPEVKMPLNGSNIDNNIITQQNANDIITPATKNVITNEDTINSNKLVSDEQQTSDAL